jgi:hypothetical protein
MRFFFFFFFFFFLNMFELAEKKPVGKLRACPVTVPQRTAELVSVYQKERY